MTDILVMSGTGAVDFDIDISDYGTLASVMNHRGLTNKWGNPLNANALKKVVQRMREKGLVQEYAPEWNLFDSPTSMRMLYERFVQMKLDTSGDYQQIH